MKGMKRDIDLTILKKRAEASFKYEKQTKTLSVAFKNKNTFSPLFLLLVKRSIFFTEFQNRV